MFGYYGVNNYLNLAYHPVESAMTNGDDLVHLLVRLGASVDTIPKTIAESSYYENKMSLKVWIDNEIFKLDTRIKSAVKAPAVSITTPPECSGWQKFYREYQDLLKTPEEERKQVLNNEKEERERLEKLEKLEDAKAYFVEVKQLMEDHGAKTLGKITTDETPSPVLIGGGSPSKGEPRYYKFLSAGYLFIDRDVPQHLISSYDQLYEACYVGDHEKIQSLCLPAEGAQPGSILLNISVKMVDYGGKRLPEAP